MTKKIKQSIAIISIVVGLIFGALAAPEQVAKGYMHWNAILESQSVTEAFEKIADPSEDR